MSDIKLNLTDENLPRRSDYTKNRELLLTTARRLFIKNGVDNVTMSDIAKAAGVGQGTMYRHFENKLEVSLALLDEDQRDLQQRSLAQMRQSGDPEQNLRWFVTEVLQFVDRNSQLLCVNGAGAASLQTAAHWWWRQTIRGLLEQLEAPGNLDFIADSIYLMLEVHNIYFLRQVRGFSLDQVTTNFLILIGRITQ